MSDRDEEGEDDGDDDDDDDGLELYGVGDDICDTVDTAAVVGAKVLVLVIVEIGLVELSPGKPVISRYGDSDTHLATCST